MKGVITQLPTQKSQQIAEHPISSSKVKWADAASQLLRAVLGPHGAHPRTSVGAAQLPKGATVELDFIFRVKPATD